MKKILLTGAAGVLGQALVRKIIRCQIPAEIVALDLDKDHLQKVFSEEDRVKYYDLQDFEADKIDFDSLDCLVHCAFSRSQIGTALAASIDFTKKIFEAALRGNVNRVINISSQSVYGNYREIASSENDSVNPHDLYGMAKYACETLGNILFSNSDTEFINIRMASLVGKAYPERIINKMVKFAIENNRIKIVGGSQLFSFLHVEDAAQALVELINAPADILKNTYNLGTAECYNIRQLAEVIAEMLEAKYGRKINIEVDVTDVKHSIPLDVSAFFRDLGWSASWNLRDIVAEVIDSADAGGR